MFFQGLKASSKPVALGTANPTWEQRDPPPHPRFIRASLHRGGGKAEGKRQASSRGHFQPLWCGKLYRRFLFYAVGVPFLVQPTHRLRKRENMFGDSFRGSQKNCCILLGGYPHDSCAFWLYFTSSSRPRFFDATKAKEQHKDPALRKILPLLDHILR